jgi:hypothetical protein
VAAGTYFVTVTDSKGCTETSSATVTVTDPLTFRLDPDQPECPGQLGSIMTTITSDGSGSLTYSWAQAGVSTFSRTTQNLSGLSSGTYILTVEDKNECTATNSASITTVNPIVITATPSPASCTGTPGSVSVSATGGTPRYTYSITVGTSIWNAASQSSGQVYEFSPIAAGGYTVTVTDSRGCIETEPVNVATVPCICTLTQGYWKTRHPYSPTGTPKDPDTWGQIPGGVNGTFYTCEQYTWYTILTTSPKGGNAVLIAGKQYVAAYLNMLRGTLDPNTATNWNFLDPEVGECFLKLQAYFTNSTIDCTIPGKGSDERIMLVSCGRILNNFNNGLYDGAPHCDSLEARSAIPTTFEHDDAAEARSNEHPTTEHDRK